MKYTAHYTVKWHDTDANRKVRPSAILMYMQETANLQLRAYGMPLDQIRDEKGLAFLLSRISIQYIEPLYAFDEIDVETWVSDGNGFRFPRNFCIYRDGKPVAKAFSEWALMNLKENRLMKTNEFSYGFEGDVSLDMTIPKRVHCPNGTEMKLIGERTVRYADIDYNFHMNNTHYPDMLCDFLPDVHEKRITGMALSYLHGADYNHTLKVYCGQNAGDFWFRTVDGDGTVCLEALVQTESFSEGCV